jgi:Protein of unknown function (DUF2939)
MRPSHAAINQLNGTNEVAPMDWRCFALLWAALPVWPLIGLYRIGAAVEARDSTALAERVEFRSLRLSLAQQVIAEYLKLTGKEKKLGRFRTGIATGVGAALAEPIIAEFLNAETLIDFLAKGRTKTGKLSSESAPFSSGSLRSAWRVWWHSEFWGKNFYVYLPPEKAKGEQFGVRLNFRDWRWKITGMDLPEALRVRLAKELVKQQQD